MRLGRLHTDTIDQYWGLIDLNSSQELFSYGRYIIPIFTPCSYQSYKPKLFTPISYPEYAGSLIGGGSPGEFSVGHSPFTTVNSAVKKYSYFKGFPDDQLLTNGGSSSTLGMRMLLICLNRLTLWQFQIT